MVLQRRKKRVPSAAPYGRSEPVKRALRLFHKDKGGVALEVLEAYIATHRDGGALLLKANMLQALGRLDAAERTYRSLVRLQPENAAALTDLADYYAAGGYWARARRIYLRALAVLKGRYDGRRNDGPYVASMRGMAKIEAQGGKPEIAVRRLAKAILEGPWDWAIVGDLCHYYEQHFKERSRRRRKTGRHRK